MMQCDFQPRGNWWICLTCGIVVPKRGDKPPRATCAEKWVVPRTESRSKRKRKPPSRRESVLHHYDIAQMTDPPRAEIERRLDVCEACEEFADYLCIKAGSPCRKVDNWRNKVLIGRCEKHA